MERSVTLIKKVKEAAAKADTQPYNWIADKGITDVNGVALEEKWDNGTITDAELEQVLDN